MAGRILKDLKDEGKDVQRSAAEIMPDAILEGMMGYPVNCRLPQPSETPKGADDEHYPPNVVMAVLLGAFLLHGVEPGPLLIKEHPETSGASLRACRSATRCCSC